jgi:N-acetylmuramoyl-L-alanine amidase
LTARKTERIITLCGIFFFVLALLSPLPVAALNSSEVTGVSYRSYPDHTEVVITLSHKAVFTKNRLSNPDRLYFDIKNCGIGRAVRPVIPVANGMVRSVRAAQFTGGTVRVVLDLERTAAFKVADLDDPERIVVAVYGVSMADADVAAPPTVLKKRIVIDPGHGGHDSGAVGPDGLYEKDVVLDIALKLRQILSTDPNYEVFLTRDGDVFIPLAERNTIANRKHADLFVSIHANASPRRDARGVETYFLNWTNDEETMKVAARENQISLRQMRQMKQQTDVLDVMLGDLARDNKRDESMALANYIQKKLVDGIDRDNPHVVNLGVKWALFYVLFGARMPSVLVEVSFISNPLEEKLLSKQQYREDIARSIAAGIERYMESTPGQQTIARNR